MPSGTSASPSPLLPITNETASSSYLAELVPELPYVASQFGLVLTTALEYRENPESVCCKQPGGTSIIGGDQHFRTNPMPSGEASLTQVDMTISDSTTFYARCEPALMRAAALEGVDTLDSTQDNTEAIANGATADNFSKALEKKPVDPVVHGHYKNVLSAISSVLEHRSAERSRLGKENSPDNFYCVNDIWINPLSSIAGGGLRIWNRAVKFAITEEQLLAEEPMIRARCEELEKDGFILGPMEESDIKLMLESNKVYYPEDYGKHIIKRSVCFRKDGKMVAWAGTHSDFSIAALHVLPEHRKAGLGRLVLNHLSLMHVRLAREILTTLGGKENTDIPASKLVAHADCLDDNYPTILFMERCGWHRVGFYLWLQLTYKGDKEATSKDD
ncbi:MAG: hypothetical protein J3Q66DRAFT_443973 [Benniella sp.]|nr:MAG: hypothetical protein J3Q66DRAFT_443973 [Benniella sp.]